MSEVLVYQEGIAKVRDYSFVRDVSSGHLLRKNDARTRLVSISSGAFIVYQLTDEVDVRQIVMESSDRDLLTNLAELPHDGKI